MNRETILYSTLTWSQRRRVRNAYVKLQGGKCFYCNENLHKEPPEHITSMKVNRKLFPKGFFDRPIHLQHDHTTDVVEGAVHAYCNAVMWEYEGR